jgi:hypothetical protein
MKTTRWHEVGLIFAGILMGFQLGVFAYAAFFLPPNTGQNGLAKFFATGCGLVGLVMMILIRAEMRRKDDANDKPDA